jgi:hypothetical protein
MHAFDSWLHSLEHGIVPYTLKPPYLTLGYLLMQVSPIHVLFFWFVYEDVIYLLTAPMAIQLLYFGE